MGPAVVFPPHLARGAFPPRHNTTRYAAGRVPNYISSFNSRDTLAASKINTFNCLQIRSGNAESARAPLPSWRAKNIDYRRLATDYNHGSWSSSLGVQVAPHTIRGLGACSRRDCNDENMIDLVLEDNGSSVWDVGFTEHHSECK